MLHLNLSRQRPRRGSARALLAVVAVLAGSTLAACSAGAGSSGSSHTGGGDPGNDRLSVGFIAEPASLDFTTNDGAAIPQALLVNVYEGLVRLDDQGKIEPLLAKKWTVSPDRRTYTFTLHSGVRFSNGKRFTARDAAFSINRVKTDWTISLKNAMNVVDDTDVISPTKLRVKLKRPSNSWLYSMTGRVGAMFSRSGVDHLATKPIGTGPYSLRKWTRGDSIVLERRADYWGHEPAMKTVTLRYFTDPTAMDNALRTGGIDIISNVQTPQSLSQFSDTKRFQIIEGTTNGEVVLAMNNARAPLDDKRVRRALCYAIDRKAVLDTAWAGHGTLIGSMVPPTDPWYEDLTGIYPYDPAKARKLLREAGLSHPHLRLRIPNLPYAVASAQVVKSQLAKVDVTATIDVLEFPARWLDEVYTRHDYDLSIIAHVEPRDIVKFGDPDYYWQYDNPRVQKLLKAADTGTRAQQVTRMKKVARTIAEDAAADWLFLLPNLIAADADIRGLPKNAVSESFDLTRLSRAPS